MILNMESFLWLVCVEAGKRFGFVLLLCMLDFSLAQPAFWLRMKIEDQLALHVVLPPSLILLLQLEKILFCISLYILYN